MLQQTGGPVAARSYVYSPQCQLVADVSFRGAPSNS